MCSDTCICLHQLSKEQNMPRNVTKLTSKIERMFNLLEKNFGSAEKLFSDLSNWSQMLNMMQSPQAMSMYATFYI